MSDFFTRLIAANEAGPNIPSMGAGGSDNDIAVVYFCGACDEEYCSGYEAEACCAPKAYREYRCNECSETHHSKALAMSCCSGDASRRFCPMCMQPASSYEDAADCCLFKHPQLTQVGRQMVAKAVEGGQSWLDAVAAHINH